MRSFTKTLMILLAACMASFQGIAQEDCDCPGDDPILTYCVIDLDSGEVFSMESTSCEMFCEGYLLFWEGDCGDVDPGDGGDDIPDPCDCDDDDEATEWCVFDPFTGEQISLVATECEMFCEGYFVFSEGPCDDDGGWGDWPEPCDCDYDNYEPVCVTLDDGTLCSFYNPCEAECFGYTDYAEGECEYDWEPEDCDCPEDEPVLEYCVFDLWTGAEYSVEGTECQLFCDGYLILSDGDCEGEEPGDGEPCDCGDDEEIVEWCVIDIFTGEQFSMEASECEMFCEGYFLFFEGPCGEEPSECDCDYDEYAPVCVTLEDGTLCTFFNACEAECYGYSDYSEGECDYGWDPEDCDCPEDEEAGEYCVIDLWTGETYVVTGTECELFCEGFLVVGDGDCEEDGGGDDPDDNPEDCDCPEDEPTTEFCVLNFETGEFEAVESTECELACEGLFIFWEGPCDIDGEGDEEEDGDGVDGDGNTLVALEDYSETYEIGEVALYPNPAGELLNVSVKSNMEGNVVVALYSLTGQLLLTEQWTTQEGVQVKQLALDQLAPGMYTLTLTTPAGNSTAMQVVKR